MRESIFSSSLRSFFVTLFGVAGVLTGLILITIIVGALSKSGEGSMQEINHSYQPEIVANAEGIRKVLASDAPVILKLNITGVIGTDKLTARHINQLLIESREQTLADGRVKGILLHVNSPGGLAIDGDAIYRSIKAYKEKYNVPVYAYVDGLCASGGFYIACAADKIYASDTSIVGSVGVVLTPALNFSKLMEKVGIDSLTISDGKNKDPLNPLRPWKAGEEENIKQIVEYYYKVFVDVVTSNRAKLDRTKLIEVYGANVYPSPLAKDFGFIDESGYSLNQTLKLLVETMGIHDDNYQVVQLKSSNWLSELFESKANLLLKGEVTHHFQWSPETHPKLQNQYLYFYRP